MTNTTLAIERGLESEGLLQGGLIGPIRIVDQEELDMLESMIEQGGSLLDLVDGYGAGRLRAAGSGLAPPGASCSTGSGLPSQLSPAITRTSCSGCSGNGRNPYFR